MKLYLKQMYIQMLHAVVCSLKAKRVLAHLKDGYKDLQSLYVAPDWPSTTAARFWSTSG